MEPINSHPLIAKEGWPFIAAGLLATIVVAAWSWVVALPFALFTIFALQFFRDPKRDVPALADAKTVLSAADGVVICVEPSWDPYAQREALKISVFMNVFNVHSNRVPVDGTVQKVTYFPGKFFNAALDKASMRNERNAVVVKTEDGQIVSYVQVAGLVARRIVCYAQKGDQLKKGQRYGFIRFGSRVDHYLPITAQPNVVIGDKVQATQTILAHLN